MRYFMLLVVAFLSASVVAQDQKAVSYAGLNWSRDGKWLAYTKMNITQSKPPKVDADVYVVRADGSGITRVTGDGANEFETSFSRDARTVYFGRTSDADKEGNVFSIGVDGSSIKQLTRGLPHAASPQVSPNGKWIAFNVSHTEHKPQIYVMRADGADPKRLTNDDTVAFYDPVWSPDGKRLVYYVERGDQKDQIWSMKADGTEQKLLTANIGHNFYPSWSANGKRIVFTSNRGGKQEIFTMAADGSDVKAAGIEAFYARQSPDGKKTAYIAGKFPNMTLFIANNDGSGAAKLLK
jgi:Tol biopolymer transport system component